jgi:hypothetical protein
LGTNAVPFLVDEVFTYRRDTRLRSNLNRLFHRLPEWAGRGAFTPYSEVHYQPERRLRDLRPSADVLLPLLQPYLDATNLNDTMQAIHLVGFIGQGGEAVVPQLLQLATNHPNPRIQSMANHAIRFLGVRSSNALPAVLDQLQNLPNPERPVAQWLPWMAELGPAALPAVPLLEDLLTRTNLSEPVWIGAAVALIHIDPNHRAALRALTKAAGLSLSTQTLYASRWFSCSAISRAPPRSIPHLAPLVEPLARFEMAEWSPRGGSAVAIEALTRIAPDRARILLESFLTPPSSASLKAATQLLRLDPNHEVATRMLASAVSSSPAANSMALSGLAEASSSNRIAIAALQDVLAGKPGPTDQVLEQAREALARIRYREALAARGLHDENL